MTTALMTFLAFAVLIIFTGFVWAAVAAGSDYDDELEEYHKNHK